MFPVNVIHITLRVFTDALPGNPEQVIPFSERERLFGTGFNTSGEPALNDPGMTHRTLHHPGGKRAVIFISGYVEGAGNHAVPTSDAYRRIIRDRPFFCFCKSLYKTC